jgi:hypothetical protein
MCRISLSVLYFVISIACYKCIHYRYYAGIQSCLCNVNTVNVFARGKTLPGRLEASVAATTPCRLQLCTVSGISASPLAVSAVGTFGLHRERTLLLTT